MAVEKYKDTIDEIHSEYINELKPLIALVEHNYRRFPIGILKEFRDVFDHISRLYIEGQTDDYYKTNLNKAINHFDRLKLDVYKYVCDLKKKHIDKWIKRYSKYDMSCVDNGEFWEKITEDFDDCERIFYDGQAKEHLDIKEACTYYEKYVYKCRDVFKYIDSKKVHIRKVKYKYYNTAIGSAIVGLIIGIIGSIIASIIWTSTIEPIFKKTDSDAVAVNSSTQAIIKQSPLS